MRSLPPDLESVPKPTSGPTVPETIFRLLVLLFLLFCFLVSIETMSKAIKALASAGILGGVDEGELFKGVANPFAGLSIGVLFTVLVQSSSTTTSTIVAVVGSGALSVKHAVPMILGANIGTTVTNTLVSLGHVSNSNDFRRAFAAATVHDFFNLLMVLVFLPLEIATGFLTRSAGAISGLVGNVEGAKFKSPIKSAIKSAHGMLGDALEGVGLTGGALAGVSLVVGIALTMCCLVLITKNMRVVIAGRVEAGMNRVLDSTGLMPLLVGIGVTVAVQSSSITTSLLVPMCAAGVLPLAKAFPVMLGANIGTTVTALLASMAQDDPAALQIALVHVLFNVLGVTLIYTIPSLRKLPISLAMGLADRATRNRLWILAYVVGAFIVLPVLGWVLWGNT